MSLNCTSIYIPGGVLLALSLIMSSSSEKGDLQESKVLVISSRGALGPYVLYAPLQHRDPRPFM